MAYNQARRNELAREAGFSSYSAMRRAGAEERARAREAAGQTYGLARQVGTQRQHAAARAEQRDASVALGDAELTSGRYASTLRGAIDRAVTNDQLLTAIVTVRLDDGTLRDVELWRKGGWSAERFRDNVRAMGTKPAFLDQVEKVFAAHSYGAAAVAVVHVDLTAY